MARTFERTWEWRFDRPPEALWPALADTARWNEAAGIPRHAIEERTQPDGSVRYFGHARRGPFTLSWEEIPVEWVAGSWFRHLRVFENGPIRSIEATLRLAPADGSTSVAHYTLVASAANPLGTLVLATAFFPVARRIFTSLADQARDWADGQRARPFAGAPPSLSGAARQWLEPRLARVEASPHGHGRARRLAEWLLAAQEVDVFRVRPLALAREWGAPAREVIELCLESTRAGLLQAQWDLLCPRCRGAKVRVNSLDQLPREAHCGACNIDYERDFVRNMELTFQPASPLRGVGNGEYCLFGPMTAPHIPVQLIVGAGAERTVDATLAPGRYRLRTLEIGGESDMTWDGGGFPSIIAEGGTVRAGDPSPLGTLQLINREDRPRTMIIEMRDWQGEALTAHRVSTMQAFRDLFGGEVLRPGDDVRVGHVTLMFTDLKGSTAFYERVGDARAYGVVREHFAYLAAAVRRHDGAIVKTIGDAVMAAFALPNDGVRAALDIQRNVATFNARLGQEAVLIKVGLHAGPCIAVTLNERLDYFGSTVNLAARLQGESDGGDIVLSRSLADDPAVQPLLAEVPQMPIAATLRGIAEPVAAIRLVPRAP